MTDPSDTPPLVPRRPLGPRPHTTGSTAGSSAGPMTAASTSPDDTREVTSSASIGGQSRPMPTYAPEPQAYSGPDTHAERGLPVPPSAGPGERSGAAANSMTVDKVADHPAPETSRQRPARTVRRAKLRVVRLDPWSVTKSAFLLSIAFGVMCVVAVFLVFSIMSASGLWDSVNTTIQGVVNQKPSEAFDIEDYVGMSRVMGVTMLISVVDVVIITALATLGAFIYNMSASLLGGIEVTLAEDLN